MIKLSLLFLFLISLAFGCTEDEEAVKYKDSFTGYTRESLDKVCYFFDHNQCQAIDPLETEFKNKCEQLGHESYFCSCEVILCSFDINKESTFLKK